MDDTKVRSGSRGSEGVTGPVLSQAALGQLNVAPIPMRLARAVLVEHHYLHSLPGGTYLALGVFSGPSLTGALTCGAGPANAHRLVAGARREDCATLTRLWLSDELPPNSESRVIGLCLRALRKGTSLKFLVTYADPAQGHAGTIYQATNWVYTGLSVAMPLYDLGDGRLWHSRSLSHAYGTHSRQHFRRHGVELRVQRQGRKHRYLYFLDPSWRRRLRVPVLPYPKKEAAA